VVWSGLEKRPAAVLLGANNNGYATVQFDAESVAWFVSNLHKIKSYANRSLVWNFLEHEVDQARMDPLLFVEAAEKNLVKEESSNLVPIIVGRLNKILRFQTASLEKRMELRARLNALYQTKLENGMLAKEFLWTLSGAQMQQHALDWLAHGAITLHDASHALPKTARYILIQKAFACDFFTLDQKMAFYNA